ncbi:MAG TPA: hypothetical protein VF021_09620 [Longimicrobiales bacterium]
MNTDQLEAIAMVVVAFFIGASVLIPVVAFSARFALKPVMETWLRLKQSQTSDQDKITQDRRIALLEAELQSLQQVLEQRVDAHEFDLQLAKPQNEVRE